MEGVMDRMRSETRPSRESIHFRLRSYARVCILTVNERLLSARKLLEPDDLAGLARQLEDVQSCFRAIDGVEIAAIVDVYIVSRDHAVTVLDTAHLNA